MPTAESVCLSLTALLLSVAALAADNDTGLAVSPDALDEVVVTAQKHSQDVQDIGVAIDTASGAELEALRIQQPLNFAMMASSLSTMNSTTDSTPLFLIRGIGLDVFFNNN
jgi:iron complex outermembrane receptor protein